MHRLALNITQKCLAAGLRHRSHRSPSWIKREGREVEEREREREGRGGGKGGERKGIKGGKRGISPPFIFSGYAHG